MSIDETLPAVYAGFDSPRQVLLLSVIIPVYNERFTLARIIRAVMLTLPDTKKEIVIVDDCSKDGTREWLIETFPAAELCIAKLRRSDDGGVEFFTSEQSPPQNDGHLETVSGSVTVRRILQEKNGGKGKALRTGFAKATGDVIVIQDADLEYDPSDWSPMIRLVELGIADVVYGSRFYGNPHRSLYLYHLLGNKVITYLFNILFDQTLTDIETCYKMFRRKTSRWCRPHQQ